MSEWSGQAYGFAELGREVADIAPELSTTTGGIRGKEDGACVECIPSSPGKGVIGFHQHHPTDAVNRPQERGIDDSQIPEVVSQGNGRQLSIGPLCVGTSGEAPAKASPLYLLSSEIVDIVELSEQYRAEEEAAAEEGALTEASGMPDPKFESNGRY